MSGRRLHEGNNDITIAAKCAGCWLGACAVLICLAASDAATAAVIADASNDFSVANNPNGAWTYGWSTTLTSPLNVYSNGFVAGNGAQVWNDPSHNFLGAPGDFNNQTDNAIGAIPPHTAGLHPGSGGEFSHFVWTSTVTGIVSVAATFTPIDSGGVDVHILDNGLSLFSGDVSPGNPQSFTALVPVLVGDKLDFAVGFGNDGNFFSDSTGLTATISTVPEPATSALAVMGFLVLLLFGRRR